MRNATQVLLIAATVAAAAAATPAHAVNRTLAFMANGSGLCQAALPAFEGLVRKRPAALQNEGTSTAFVTCSPVSLQEQAGSPIGRGLYFVNYGEAPATVTCTAVSSVFGVPEWSSTKAVSVNNANGSQNVLYWYASDGLPADNADPVSFSCGLPPNVGITAVFVNQVIDVGN